jgi:hypothetical protein
MSAVGRFNEKAAIAAGAAAIANNAIWRPERKLKKPKVAIKSKSHHLRRDTVPMTP